LFYRIFVCVFVIIIIIIIINPNLVGLYLSVVVVWTSVVVVKVDVFAGVSPIMIVSTVILLVAPLGHTFIIPINFITLRSI